MGRVYSINPDVSKGELLPVRKSGVYTHTGAAIRGLSRVEFDHDTDRGLATVTSMLITSDQLPILDPEKNAHVAVTYRAWVQIVNHGEKPIAVAQDDLIRNPECGPGQEPFVLWSELEKAANDVKKQLEPIAA